MSPMRVSAVLACVMAGLEAAARGGGAVEQVLFGQDMTWLWFVVAFAWGWAGVHIAFKGC